MSLSLISVLSKISLLTIYKKVLENVALYDITNKIMLTIRYYFLDKI